MLSADELFPRGCFGLDDIWLGPRVRQMMSASFEKPGACFGSQFESRADVIGAYRLCARNEIDLSTILTPALSQVGQLIASGEVGQTVLCVQDTTEIELTHLKEMRGLGETGNPACRGFFLHSAMACTTTGVPVGLLGAKTWIREAHEHGKARQRHQRLFEDKESVRWWTTMEEVEALVAKPRRLVHVFDREGDVFDVLARAGASGSRVVVRAAQSRWVEGPQKTLWETVANFRPSGAREVWIPARPKTSDHPAREARHVRLVLRSGPVTLRNHDHRTWAAPLWAVQAREEYAGTDPIDWMLLTTDEVTTPQQAWEKLDWYLLRWRIEEYHRALKTICRVEHRQFHERGHLEVAMSFMLLSSVKCLALRDESRQEPDTPAKIRFTPDEMAVLQARAKVRGVQAEKMTLAQAVLLVAMMGGFLGRRRDGLPGIQTIWRGYVVLQERVEGYRLGRDADKRRFTEPIALSPSPAPQPAKRV
jgi:hypothetical protein